LTNANVIAVCFKQCQMETYCGLALSGQRLGRYPGLCVQAVGSGLCGQRLRARDESALEVARWTTGLRRSRRCATQIDSFYLYLQIPGQHFKSIL